MSVINILDKSVAELIAAGEVVERPASIVKELVENSIDAGATDISVEISGGGVRMIRISDNGCGISREDIPKSFLRHATSKTCKAEDLDSILTLGFRGEALASVAAVCKVEMLSKTDGETEATSYSIEGGECTGCAPAARPTGTTVTIRDVFFNTPARMKFLKKDISEGNAVAQVVDKCALSHPEIAFRFIRDGSVKLKTSGGGDLLAVIYAIYGRDLANGLIAVNYVHESYAGVTGYISKPDAVKPSRAYQSFFINGRFVRTKTGFAALEEAYKNKIMAGRFPACFLNLELDASAVDVNVHPAKIEVRFADERPVFNSVYYAVKSALQKLESPIATAKPATVAATSAPIPVQQRLTAREYRELYAEAPEAYKETPTYKPIHPPDSDIAKRPVFRSTLIDIAVDDDYKPEKYDNVTDFAKIIPNERDKIFYKPATNRTNIGTICIEAREAPKLRMVGEVLGAYILLEDGEGLLLIDKHAAHERILYERIKSEISYGNRQTLLSPQSVLLSRDEHAAVIENLDAFESMGFMAEDFGGSAVIVREVPIELSESDIALTVREIADKLKGNSVDLTPNVLDRLYYSIACRAAIKAGDKNTTEELAQIIRLLEENQGITHCPHGRPIFVRLTAKEIEKRFGRLG